jgi:hypothetical protein
VSTMLPVDTSGVAVQYTRYSGENVGHIFVVMIPKTNSSVSFLAPGTTQYARSRLSSQLRPIIAIVEKAESWAPLSHPNTMTIPMESHFVGHG